MNPHDSLPQYGSHHNYSNAPPSQEDLPQYGAHQGYSNAPSPLEQLPQYGAHQGYSNAPPSQEDLPQYGAHQGYSNAPPSQEQLPQYGSYHGYSNAPPPSHNAPMNSSFMPMQTPPGPTACSSQMPPSYDTIQQPNNGAGLGWMTQNRTINPNNPVCNIILAAINSSKHPITPENLSWLYYWTGANYLEESANSNVNNPTIRTNFESRIHFLAYSWNDPHFQPFETIVSAQNFINATQATDYVIVRLSSSTPGNITVTKFNPSYNQVTHKRFVVDNQSKLVGDGQVFANIGEFVQSLTGVKQCPMYE